MRWAACCCCSGVSAGGRPNAFLAALARPMPNGAASTAPQKHEVSVTVNGDFTLNHPNGVPAAAPVSVSTQVGAP
jgi:hypothetical protein